MALPPKSSNTANSRREKFSITRWISLLRETRIDIVCLAGFLRLLSPRFTEKWRGRMINIHPSLLPAFKGLHTHRRALESGAKVHGCTVHFVEPELDSGPIILQAEVPVKPGDDEDTLAARVLAEEHRIYPQALRLVAEGKAPRFSASLQFFAFSSQADRRYDRRR